MKQKNKKFIPLVLTLMIVLFSVFASACSLNKARYNLSSGHVGDTDISNAFDYNYIELNEKEGTYRLENKATTNGIVIKQTGSYSVNNDNIMTITNNEIPSNNYFLGSGETIKLIGNTISVSCYISYLGKCEMIFIKK